MKLFVAGQWLGLTDSPNLTGQPTHNPATGAALADVPLADAALLELAVQSAVRGFAAWRAKTPFERCLVLQQAARLMRERAPDWAKSLTAEQGKPLSEALREINLSADLLDFQAEEGKRLYGRTIAPRTAGVLSQSVVREPIGVVAAFTAWNFPVNLPTRKLASALAAGCAVILKPDNQTAGSSAQLVQCLLDAGLPSEAVQLVCGVPHAVSEYLIAHPDVAKISFTGSVPVGNLLAQQCAKHGKRFTGELGGYASVIVCHDMGSPADIAAVVKLCIAAKFRNAGQVCASPIRFLVHRDFYDAWVQRFTAQAQALKLGAGDNPSTQMGPLVHAGRILDMQRLVQDAVAQGANLLCGGGVVPAHKLSPGLKSDLFFEPTVLVDVPASAQVACEEPFGPIAILEPFDDLKSAIATANALPYGLAAYGFTRNLISSHELSTGLKAGMVGINHFGVSQPEAPFGGVKASCGIGAGSEMGAEGLLPYTDLKLISVAAI